MYTDQVVKFEEFNVMFSFTNNLFGFLLLCRCSLGHLDIQVFSSKENVSVTVNGKLVSI